MAASDGATLVARDLEAAYGDRQLFSDVDLVVGPGDVVGLVGANGAGKSTLLRLLVSLAAADGSPADLGPEPARAYPAGAAAAEATAPGSAQPAARPAHGPTPPDPGPPSPAPDPAAEAGLAGSGQLALSPPGATIGYLPQEPDRRAGETVAQFIARRTGVAAAGDAMQAAAEAMALEAPGAGDDYARELDRWLDLGGADLEERAEAVTAALGLSVDLGHLMTALSGGQAARAGLASLLLSRYDILLLDEPTNDLDLDGLTRLEDFVAERRGGTVLVSHDREFLERTVTRVVELDLAQQQSATYGGGYAGYLAEREVARRHARGQYEEYAQTRAGLEERARTQRNWMEKGVRNARRKATDPDKNVKAYRAESSEKQAAKARQTDRRIDRLEVVAEPRKEWELRMEIAVAPRAGAIVAALRGAVVRRGPFTLGPVDLQIDWADRVAITGPNGSGKTTLLGALLGRIPLDEGHAWIGPGVVVGEVDQARGLFLGGEPLLDAFRSAVPDQLPEEARTLLAKFGLGADHVLRPASTLSPGERTRAVLALLQARGVNLLVLDEPTNHLDLPAIEQLESALASYPGTLLLVTHDRRMLTAVTTNRHVSVDGGKVSSD
jgi:ATPase subunit of ABC transporter with duplicated ATPase domains